MITNFKLLGAEAAEEQHQAIQSVPCTVKEFDLVNGLLSFYGTSVESR